MNYEKIYKELLKQIKRFEESEKKYGCYEMDGTNMETIRDYLCTDYALTIFKVLNEIIDEVKGKKWHNQIMHKEEFKQWKEEIKNV